MLEKSLSLAYIRNTHLMKKMICILLVLAALIMSGFSYFSVESDEEKAFNIEDLYDYQKEFQAEEISVCSTNTAKTYMDYHMTTAVSSRQYQFLNYECTVDENTGFLYDEDGFIAVALGSYYGEIGDRYYFTLDSGIVLPLVKAEEKADVDTDANNCYHTIDGSVIEFVIDADYARGYFWCNDNGYVLNGNYNNHPLFNGCISKVEKVLEEKAENIVSYTYDNNIPTNTDIFNYASGY